jgi:DNA-3-methyladenine glycosylase
MRQGLCYNAPVNRLGRTFFARDTLTVARDLLGRHLVRVLDGERISGRIVEAEAYTGFDDRASHGHRGKTDRNAVMFGPVGVSYVYFTYGMHWLLNVVARPEGVDYPAAVLLRAIEPLTGLERIAAHRIGRPPHEWTDGPAKLTKALAIDKALSGIDTTAPDAPLYIEAGQPFPDNAVQTGPRVGLGQTPEPWFSMPWRFYVTDNPYVSRYR